MASRQKSTERVGRRCVKRGWAEGLFDRIVSILDEARGRVVRTINQETVTAYWMIGREIVVALQGGEARAEYGARLIEDLSTRLSARYGRGFSTTNLWDFRQFFLTYGDRNTAEEILRPVGGESDGSPGFHAGLSWSHYRALMRVENAEARRFYEGEAIAGGWSKLQLERQIATMFYERLLMSRNKSAMLKAARDPRQAIGSLTPLDVLKDPYVLEFLDLPDFAQLHESKLEAAIIEKLQRFLLELGRGFSLVGRQKRLRFDDEDFYVDLVFYNYLLRCFVLIDLKVGRLTHQDVGQMDSYVRMFDTHSRVKGDNPAIGLILCSKKNEAVARYSVLHENRQLFAAKYVTYLPTEQELQRELERERRSVEARGDPPHPICPPLAKARRRSR